MRYFGYPFKGSVPNSLFHRDSEGHLEVGQNLLWVVTCKKCGCRFFELFSFLLHDFKLSKTIQNQCLPGLLKARSVLEIFYLKQFWVCSGQIPTVCRLMSYISPSYMPSLLLSLVWRGNASPDENSPCGTLGFQLVYFLNQVPHQCITPDST